MSGLASEKPAPNATVPGVFIGKGMSVSIPVGGFSITANPDGTFGGSISIHLAYDVTPLWLEAALRHVHRAAAARDEIAKVWPGVDEDAKHAALESQAEASMQAIVAAATAVDGFYAATKECVLIDKTLVAKWRRGRTPRYAQIAEVFKRAYAIKEPAKVRQMLAELYRFRDWSVHPPASASPPVEYPGLNVKTDWRFLAFRHENAIGALRLAVSIISELATKPRQKWKPLKVYANGVSARVADVTKAFEVVWVTHKSVTAEGADAEQYPVQGA